MKTNKPKLKLLGENGNVFVVLGLARRAATKSGWTKAQIDAFIAEATSGDYDHALVTCMKHFDVE